MATSVKAGFDCKVEVNTTGVSGGTWVEVTLARDLTLTLERAEIDASSRGGDGWRERIGGLKDGTVELEILDATAAGNGYSILRDAFLNGTLIGVRVLNGETAGTGGVEGIVMLMTVLNFTRNEPLEDVVTWNVSLSNAPGATPSWLPGS